LLFGSGQTGPRLWGGSKLCLGGVGAFERKGGKTPIPQLVVDPVPDELELEVPDPEVDPEAPLPPASFAGAAAVFASDPEADPASLPPSFFVSLFPSAGAVSVEAEPLFGA
jgi:hypothetical protein